MKTIFLILTWCDKEYVFRFGRFVLSGILENCEASVKAEVGPTFSHFFNHCRGSGSDF
jgi:hypothetical protein